MILRLIYLVSTEYGLHTPAFLPHPRDVDTVVVELTGGHSVQVYPEICPYKVENKVEVSASTANALGAFLALIRIYRHLSGLSVGSSSAQFSQP